MATIFQAPVGYSPEARAEILSHVFMELAAGRAVQKVLKEDEGMPSVQTFWSWIASDEEALEGLAHARSLAVERYLTEVIDIVDNTTDDVRVEYDQNGNPYAQIDGYTVRRATLMAEYRLKVAAMLLPRKYGPKVDVTSGGEALKPTQLTDNRVQALVTMAIERAAAARLAHGDGDKE